MEFSVKVTFPLNEERSRMGVPVKVHDLWVVNDEEYNWTDDRNQSRFSLEEALQMIEYSYKYVDTTAIHTIEPHVKAE